MTEPLQWQQRAILEIQRAGISIYRLAVKMGEPYRTVQRWQNGAEPKYSQGVLLMAIHDEYVPRETISNETNKVKSETTARAP